MIIGAYILPCGAIALHPDHNDPGYENPDLAQELSDICYQTGKRLAEQKPDAIFLISPHGVTDMYDYFNIYMNKTGEGRVGYGDCDTCQKLRHHTMDVSLAEDVLSGLRGKGHKINGMKMYGGMKEGCEIPNLLRWGETIPLAFIPGSESIGLCVLSVPFMLPDRSRALKMSEALGKDLAQILEKSSKRVAVLIGGDLNHYHHKDGVCGFREDADVFDQLCENWVSSMEEHYLEDALAQGYPKTVSSCIFPGLFALRGILSETGGKTVWQSKVHINCHPSYFGMMVAVFSRKYSVPIIGK